MRQAKVIAIGNQKGGVAKTTNTVHIGRALAERGRKVLIIDLDMNHCATRHFGIEPEAFMGAYQMMIEDEPANNLVISGTMEEEGVIMPENLDLIPASRKLEGIDSAAMAKSKFMSPIDLLREPLAALRPEYDYILLDTAPNATFPTRAAYLSADYFILSTKPDAFSVAGLNDAVNDIIDARKRGNSKLHLLGVVLCAMDSRTTLANKLSSEVEKCFTLVEGVGSLKFDTIISSSTVVAQTQRAGKTLFETHSTHKVTDQYRSLATEIEARLAALVAQQQGPAMVAKEVANG